MVSVKSMLNDSYCRDISVKTRSALDIKRNNGDYVGACPIYGYRRSDDNKNRLVPDEFTAAVVNDIFRMKINGMSALKIAETLNSLGVLSPIAYKRDRGLPHPTGGFADAPNAKWSATTVFRILNNETYTGVLIQGRQTTTSYKVPDIVNKSESELNRIEGAHEAIISPQDFDLAQRIMKLDTRSTQGSNAVYMFSGVLICGCCGSRMTRKTNRYKGREYFYYYCPTGKKHGCKDAVMVKEGDLSECVLESVKAHIAGVASLESVLAASDSRKAAEALARQINTQIADNERQISQITVLKAALYESLVDGSITKEDCKELKAHYAANETRLRNAIAVLEDERDNALDGTADRLRWMEHFRRFEGLNELDRRTVVNLIKSIRIIGKTELEITFNYQDEYEAALGLLRGEVAA